MSFNAGSSESQLGEAMLRLLDGTLPTAAAQELNQVLRENGAARHEFARLLLQQTQLIEIGVARRAVADSSAAKAAVRSASVIPRIAFPTGLLDRWVRDRLNACCDLWSHFTKPARLSLASALLIGLGMLVWFVFPLPSAPVVRRMAESSIELLRDGRVLAVQDGASLRTGDLIRTDPSHPAMITYASQPVVIHLAGASALRIIPSMWGRRLELVQGHLEATVARQHRLRPLVITTGQAKATVVGTEFRLDTAVNQTRLEVFHGLVRFESLINGQAVDVGGGSNAVAGVGQIVAAKPTTGGLLREIWLDLPGDTLKDLTYDPRYPNQPKGHDFPSTFETNTNWPSAFGTRIRGYLLPPATGEYEFQVGGLGQMALWLSPDEDAAGKVKIAQIAFTRNRPGDAKPRQTHSQISSDPIRLEAGVRYYIEALQKYDGGEDLLTITWKRPDGAWEAIPKECLAPFVVRKGGER